MRMLGCLDLSVGYISDRRLGPAFRHFDGCLGRIARINGKQVLRGKALLIVRSTRRPLVVVVKRGSLFDMLLGGASVVLVYHI